MEFVDAVRLIDKGILKTNIPQHWADLGAGGGLFTRSLGSLLPTKSSVLAIDKNANSLKSIVWDFPSVSLQTLAIDFTAMTYTSPKDGFLMANSLHFVTNQIDFLMLLKNSLSQDGRIIVVEYDRLQPNPWVPVPISFTKLVELGEAAGFGSVSRLHEVPSVYESTSIYSAVLA